MKLAGIALVGKRGWSCTLSRTILYNVHKSTLVIRKVFAIENSGDHDLQSSVLSSLSEPITSDPAHFPPIAPENDSDSDSTTMSRGEIPGFWYGESFYMIRFRPMNTKKWSDKLEETLTPV